MESPRPRTMMRRQRARPYGVGEHFLPGVHLARLGIRVAYRLLLPRIEEIELAGPVERLHSSRVGVRRLPIRHELRPA